MIPMHPLLVELKVPTWVLNDLKRKFYQFELSVDPNETRPHFIYTATADLIPIKVIGRIKFVVEEKSNV